MCTEQKARAPIHPILRIQKSDAAVSKPHPDQPLKIPPIRVFVCIEMFFPEKNQQLYGKIFKHFNIIELSGSDKMVRICNTAEVLVKHKLMRFQKS